VEVYLFKYRSRIYISHFPNSSADIDEKEDDLEPVEDVRDQEIHAPPQRKRASSARRQPRPAATATGAWKTRGC